MPEFDIKTTIATTEVIAISPLKAMTDSELALEFSGLVAVGVNILFVANKFTVAMFSGPSATGPWTLKASGEFDEDCAAVVTASVRTKRVWWAATDLGLPRNTQPEKLDVVAVKKNIISSWIKGSDSATGRMGNASSEVKKEVAYLAAHRCQFSGCGKDLGQHATTGQKGVFSYFAHIVAASVDGPRGHATESALLADEVSNFLLLCDECHRLIDKTDPEKYNVELLRNMRVASIREVSRLLSNLCFPEVDRFYILGNVTGQMPHVNDRDVEEALWQSKLRASSKPPESFFQFGGQHHSPHEGSYWSAVFQTLRFDLPQFQARLNGLRNNGMLRPKLAVFPLHGTSILLLAGRLLGDMPGTYLFQPHRNKIGELTQTRWSWPQDEDAPAGHKFKVKTLKDCTPGDVEANLVVSLTFGIKISRLADTSASDGYLKLPTIEISVDDPDASTIGHPTDLVLFGRAVDEALKLLQDDWGVTKVHLYVGAPPTAVVIVGQKMQARHHASYICYEALPKGASAPFASTIEISSQEVKAVGSGLTVSLQT